MLFERQKPWLSADEQLALLLSEEPIKLSVTAVNHRKPYDRCRALVIALLLTSVAGTWCLAFVLS
jgi:hypothetical protein